MADTWQKSSYCSEGSSCVHATQTPTGTVHLTESADPSGAILTAHPEAFSALIRTLTPPSCPAFEERTGLPMPEGNNIPADLDWIRAAPEGEEGPGPWIEIAYGKDDDAVYLRETSDPENVVTTTQKKWDAFVLGVQAGEFDHFVEGVD